MIEKSNTELMLVRLVDSEEFTEAYVIKGVTGVPYRYLCIPKEDIDFDDPNIYWAEEAEPLPEPKPMTALDVMWWAGVRKVTRHEDATEFYSLKDVRSDDDIESTVWNELIKLNGVVKLKYITWKEFNFENCEKDGV